VQESRAGQHLSRGRAARFWSRILRPERLRARELALLLDVDGTLVPFAATPQAVFIEPGLRHLLDQLAQSLHGALAIVSGRALDDLERLFPNCPYALVGEHGATMRLTQDEPARSCVSSAPELNAVRAILSDEVTRDPRLLLEDKGTSLALHFRRAPDRADWAAVRVCALAATLGDTVQVQRGAAVVEFRPAGVDKGTAVRVLMEQRPFLDRCAVYFGDDETDRAALAAVAELDGVPIAVGPRLANTPYERLEGPRQVRETLLTLSVGLQRERGRESS
jgi:trehalose 6-phosphate phosphatase